MNPTTKNAAPLAGIVRAQCTCCPQPQLLVNHVQLGATRMLCPESGRTFLDRGDGLFEADGEAMPTGIPAQAPVTTEDLLSDRPTRTQEKTRISLERATFA